MRHMKDMKTKALVHSTRSETSRVTFEQLLIQYFSKLLGRSSVTEELLLATCSWHVLLPLLRTVSARVRGRSIASSQEAVVPRMLTFPCCRSWTASERAGCEKSAEVRSSRQVELTTRCCGTRTAPRIHQFTSMNSFVFSFVFWDATQEKKYVLFPAGFFLARDSWCGQILCHTLSSQHPHMAEVKMQNNGSSWEAGTVLFLYIMWRLRATSSPNKSVVPEKRCRPATHTEPDEDVCLSFARFAVSAWRTTNA